MSAAFVAPRSSGQPTWLRAAGPLAALPAVGSAVAVVALANPFVHHLTPPCPFHALTGLWCPFCGGTRAVWALAHGRLGLTLHENALLPALVFVALWAWLAHLGRVTGWWRLPAPSGRVFYVVAGVSLIAFTVLRNLPAFGALAPPAVA